MPIKVRNKKTRNEDYDDDDGKEEKKDEKYGLCGERLSKLGNRTTTTTKYHFIQSIRSNGRRTEFVQTNVVPFKYRHFLCEPCCSDSDSAVHSNIEHIRVYFF